ncbi:MAG: hypothetical protein H7099_01210 [Gemmatimonadaceae bacterium]|nr:hypothetical protein [Gemmatimonadaceae bacterium]
MIRIRRRIGLLAVLVAACSPRPETPPGDAPIDSAAVHRPDPVAVMPAQLNALPARPGATVARIVVRRDTTSFSVGRAVVTLSTGDSVVVADSAVRAWKLGGSLVAVSGLDGAGGYENEGQSLTVIDVADGFRRRVVADYFAIVRVELLDAAGHRGLLVHMRDGGRGSLHVTVVDPKRGQVFRARNALGRLIDGGIAVAGYGDTDEPVEFGDKRTPLRIDTIPAAALDTLGLLVIPRAP